MTIFKYSIHVFGTRSPALPLKGPRSGPRSRWLRTRGVGDASEVRGIVGSAALSKLKRLEDRNWNTELLLFTVPLCDLVRVLRLHHRGFCYDLRTGLVKHSEAGSVSGMEQSRIYAINNQGQAVGTFRVNVIGYHALLRNIDTNGLEDLNRRLPPEQQWPKGDSSRSSSYWNLIEAWGINDQHQIVGNGSHFIDGKYLDSAFLLKQR